MVGVAKLTMLMVITPPDLPIARYSVRAIQNVLSEDVRLHIFCNGLLEEQQDLIGSWIYSDFTTISSNTAEVNQEQLASEVGRFVEGIVPGVADFREGPYESCGEVWSRETLKLQSPLVGLLDADCEVWQGHQIKDAVGMFLANPALAVASSDFSAEQEVFDSYSLTKATLAPRFHTWFCVYRREALEDFGDFSYREELSESRCLKFDHGAFLQKQLFSRGWEGALFTLASRRTYIHYGAFAKNKSLNGRRLSVYRFLRLGKHNGFSHTRWGKWSPWLSEPTRLISSLVYLLFRMSRYDKERLRYNI